MSSNGAGRASGPGVGCRVSVLAAEVGAAAVLVHVFTPRRRLMSSQAKFSFHSSRLFFQFTGVGREAG